MGTGSLIISTITAIAAAVLSTQNKEEKTNLENPEPDPIE